MKLWAPDGQSFELQIIGYQFPEMPEEQYDSSWHDSNWLVIRGKVVHPRGAWSFQDPFLLTSEVSALADWFEALAAGNEVKIEMFTEPNLEFRVHASPNGSHLRVYFGAEARSNWATRIVGADDVWVEFPLDQIDLVGAAESLRDQLRQYPQRGERSYEQANGE